MDYAIILLQLSFVHLKIEASKIPGLKIPIAFSQDLSKKKKPNNFVNFPFQTRVYFYFFLFVYCLFNKETR